LSFQHQHAAHCESGVISNLLRHHGVDMSESLAFGLAAALSFAYLPFVKVSGQPLISYRMPPKAIIKGMLAHNLLVYGRDGGDYLVSDPVFETPMRCAAADLSRARFARGLLAPKGLIYYPDSVGRTEVTPDALRRAIRKTAQRMLAPVPIVGVRGMRMLARRLQRLPAQDAASLDLVGHLVRMQEEIGTGGAGFRFIYAAFLQEAAQRGQMPQLLPFAERLTAIGDGWRLFALAAARMVKGRDALDPPALAQRLRAQADAEEGFFRDLRGAVA